MKNTIKMIGIIAMVTIITFAMTACGGNDSPGGSGDPALSGTITIIPNFYMEGYTALPPAKTVNVWNIGTEEEGSGLLSIAFQSGGDKFDASETNLANIASGESRSFTVQPKTGLAAGPHTATVMVSSSMAVKDITLTFTVTALGTSATVNSVEDFTAFMGAMPTNTASTLQPIVLNLNPVPLPLPRVYSGKFVSLDLSGSTFNGNTIDAEIVDNGEWKSATAYFYTNITGFDTITSITIPASVTSIGEYGLWGKFTSITFLTAGITLDDEFLSGFEGDTSLKTAYASGGAGTYTRPDSSSNTWTKQ